MHFKNLNINEKIFLITTLIKIKTYNCYFNIKYKYIRWKCIIKQYLSKDIESRKVAIRLFKNRDK